MKKRNNVKNSINKIDFKSIKNDIKNKLTVKTTKKTRNVDASDFVETGVEGLDKMFNYGIPKGSSVLLSGGAGSGKTIFSLQTLNHHASKGKKCLYLSYEESVGKLIKHMKDFGWEPEKLIKSKNLMILRQSPFEISRQVEALLAKQKGELLIDTKPIILPNNFKPDFVVIDSLSSIASVFINRSDSYRLYAEQLFRFFEKHDCISFFITETSQMSNQFSATGVEEFLADGVIVFYNIKQRNVRESAIEILKMRGEKHEKRMVAMQITSTGVVVYPEQEVLEIKGNE